MGIIGAALTRLFSLSNHMQPVHQSQDIADFFIDKRFRQLPGFDFLQQWVCHMMFVECIHDIHFDIQR